MKGFKKEMYELFFDKRSFPKNLRLFLVNDRDYVYVNKGYRQLGSMDKDSISFTFNRLDRGRLLDAFTKLDFLLIELVRLKISGFEWDINDKLLDLISKFTVSQRIGILKDWKTLDNDIARSLKPLFDVRNSLAHKFSENEIHYNGELLENRMVLGKLAKDLYEAWKNLVIIYSKEQEKIDLTEIKKKIQELNLS